MMASRIAKINWLRRKFRKFEFSPIQEIFDQFLLLEDVRRCSLILDFGQTILPCQPASLKNISSMAKRFKFFSRFA